MEAKATIALVMGPTIYREGLANRLGRLGHHVAIIADQGDHFIQASRQCAVDLVLVNVGPYRKPMHGMHGLVTTAYIKERWPQLPVLALSELPDEAIARRAFSAGARGFEESEVEEVLLARMLATLLRGDYFGNHYFQAYCGHVRKVVPKPVLTDQECLAELTPKEHELFAYVLEHPHLTVADIAQRQDRPYNTVKSHLHHIHQKLHVGKRAGIICFAARNGLLGTEGEATGL